MTKVIRDSRHSVGGIAGRVVVEDGVITEVAREIFDIPGAEVLSFAGCFICPGFVDLHIHGANGSDFMDCDPSAFESISRFLASHGVTSYLGTTVTAAGGVLERTVELAYPILSRQDAEDTTGFRGLHVERPSRQFRSSRRPGRRVCALACGKSNSRACEGGFQA